MGRTLTAVGLLLASGAAIAAAEREAPVSSAVYQSAEDATAIQTVGWDATGHWDGYHKSWPGHGGHFYGYPHYFYPHYFRGYSVYYGGLAVPPPYAYGTVGYGAVPGTSTYGVPYHVVPPATCPTP